MDKMNLENLVKAEIALDAAIKALMDQHPDAEFGASLEVHSAEGFNGAKIRIPQTRVSITFEV